MSNQADTPPGTGTPSAGGQELTIPKHRFDEVNARLKQIERDREVERQLFLQSQQNQRTQQRQPQFQVPTAEETGLDPQTHQAVVKIAQQLAHHQVEQVRGEARQMIGALGTQNEVNRFLLKFGKDKDDYLPVIEQRQREYMQNTGAYLDVESAYKMIRFDETESRQGRREVPPQQDTPAATQTAPQEQPRSYPGATTQSRPAGQAPSEDRPTADLSIEELEARLDEAMKSGGHAL